MGISYAIVTKVKELTEKKQYGEALDLLEGQDIYQSLNPQFLRCCGKVYLETEHYKESREALIKAHIMAPEAIRIIYDLAHLYLKLGYYTRAKKYIELYDVLASQDDVGRLFLEYMLRKAQREDAKELLSVLKKACDEEYSDEFGFELALLYASLGMNMEMKEECIHLMATYRESPYCFLSESLKKGEYDITNSLYRFPLIEVEEDPSLFKDVLKSKDNLLLEDILTLEDRQWKQDELKIHPPAPVILQMEDDLEEEQEKEKGKDKEKSSGFRFPFGKRKKKQEDTAEATEEAVVRENDAESEKPEEVETIVSDKNNSEEDNSEKKTSESELSGNAGINNSEEEAISSDSVKSIAEVGESKEATEYNENDNRDNDRKMDDSVKDDSVKDDLMKDDVSSYIESVMKSVAEIEASVAEDLQKPTSFNSEVGRTENVNHNVSNSDSSKPYQSKLVEVEDTLSPKERLEKLMKLIEADKEKEKEKKEDIYQQEEIDMDEFLMNLVGANSITQAMVKNYREEQDNNSNNGS